jgi:hypothetical protein
MTRILTFLLLVVAAGCGRAPEHARGNLTPYLQWTQGTPIIVHLAATKPSGEIIKSEIAQGSLVKVTPDALFISDALGGTNGFEKDLVLWAEKDTRK